ncbi:hypothetical protein ABZX74_39625 [Streptomyces olivaceoviridis]|uniref:hypothetical protein n=1 Tax=Streptomyces olivaceoviridis TaxID=1921 RepID=UPI0033A451FD
MSTEQHEQQSNQAPAPLSRDRRREFVREGVLAAIGGAASALVREAVKAIGSDVFGDDS